MRLISSLTARKRRAASKAVNGFPRLGPCSIRMAKLLKSRVRVRVGRVHALYKRTFKLCWGGEKYSNALVRVCVCVWMCTSMSPLRVGAQHSAVFYNYMQVAHSAHLW